MTYQQLIHFRMLGHQTGLNSFNFSFSSFLLVREKVGLVGVPVILILRLGMK